MVFRGAMASGNNNDEHETIAIAFNLSISIRYYFSGNSGPFEQQWVDALVNSIGYRNNRFLEVYNWQGIPENSSLVSAFNFAISQPVACLVDVVSTQAVSRVNSTSMQLSWQAGGDTDSIRLLVTTTINYTPGTGILMGPYIIDMDVSDQTEFVLSEVVSGQT